MMTLLPDKQVGHEVFDDFDNLSVSITNGLWQVVKGTGGTLAIQSASNGWLNVPTAASANDYQLIATANPVFKFAPGKALYVEALVSCTEANTNKANLVIGLSSITTTGFLQTGSGGPPTTFDGAVLWKQGGSVGPWQFTSSAAAVQNVNSSVATYASATQYRVGFLFDPGDGTTGYLTPFVNGVPPIFQAKPKAHPIVYGATGQLYGIFGVNAGSASAETLAIDYFRVVQFR